MHFKTVSRLIVVVLVASSATGCIFFSSPRDRAIRRSPSFQEGYSDGCAAATAPSSNYREAPARDETLYKTDSAYRAGWSSGLQTCNPAQNGMGAGSTTIPQPNPGH